MVTKKDDLITIELPQNSYLVMSQDLFVTQWNTGQKMAILGLQDGTEVQFGNDLTDKTLNRLVENGIVAIPDILLTYPETIYAYVEVVRPDSQTTKHKICILVEEKIQTGDYVYPEDEQSFREFVEEAMDSAKKSAEEANEKVKVNEEILSQIDERGASAVESINNVATGQIDAINNTALAQINAINNTATEQMKVATENIESFSQSKISAINDVANAGIGNLQQTTTQCQENVARLTDQKLSDINTTAQAQINAINDTARSQINAINETGQAQAKALEIDTLKLAIKNTSEKSDELINIPDSANFKALDFGLEGKTEQVQYSGKNMYSDRFSDYTKPVDYYICPIELKANTKYTLSARIKGTQISDSNISVSVVPNGNSYEEFETRYGIVKADGSLLSNGKNTFTINETFTSPKLAIYCSGEEQFNEIFKNYEIQLEEASTSTSYEPYTGMQIVPNPDNPQEVKNVEGSVKCRIANKNLYSDKFSDYTKVGNVFVCPINLKKNTKYTISAKLIGTQVTKNGISVLPNGTNYSDFEKCQIVYYAGDILSAGKKTFTTNDSFTDPKLAIYAGDDTEEHFNEIFENYEIQLEEDTTSTDYIPPQSQEITLTTPVPLTKWDKLVKRDGVWGWSVYHWKATLDGSSDERWIDFLSNQQETGFIPLGVLLPDETIRRTGFCNQMIVTQQQKSGMWLGVYSNIIYCMGVDYYDSSLDDKGLANWKAHLQENPLEIWTYADTEQAFYQLSDEEQNLLNNMETYYGVTNLYNDKGCPMWIKYVADTKLYIDSKLASAVSTTQALILES